MFDVAIAGLGSWGKNLVNAVQGKSTAIRFVAAATRTPSKVDDFCQQRDIRLTDDLSSVLSDAAIAGVVVAGPAQLHAEVGLAALEAGKHVMVIKPLALYRTEAEAMREAAEARGLVMAMGHDRCFLPAIEELRKRVRAGDLGRILHAEGDFCVDRYYGLTANDWKSDDANSQPGSLADHMLYTMVELVGPVAKLSVAARHQATPVTMSDTASVALQFASGATGGLTAIGVTSTFQRLHLFGTEGWAEIRNNRRFEFNPREGEASVADFPAFDALKAQLEAFAAAGQGEAAFPVTPQCAVDGVAALEAMGRAAVSGQIETV